MPRLSERGVAVGEVDAAELSAFARFALAALRGGGAGSMSWRVRAAATGRRTVLSSGDIITSVFDLNSPDVEYGIVLRVDPINGSQTTISYGQLLRHSDGVGGIATEPDGSIVVVTRMGRAGLVRINPLTGEQTQIPGGGREVAVVPTPTNPHAISNLLAPYGPPAQKRFKAGGTIPLSWQYLFNGVVMNSSAYQPVVTVNGPFNCGSSSAGEPVTVNAPGNSGYQYDSSTNTWQFNWKTDKNLNGCFNVVIVQTTLGVTATFPIEIRK